MSIERARVYCNKYHLGWEQELIRPCLDEIDYLTASLAEARRELEKYEGCIEVEGYCNAKYAQIDLAKWDERLRTVGDCTVWVKRRMP
jgi:hypothetical protein